MLPTTPQPNPTERQPETSLTQPFVRPLAALRPGQTGLIASIDGQPRQELMKAGIAPCEFVRVDACNKGSVLFSTRRKKFVLDRETAAGVSVRILHGNS